MGLCDLGRQEEAAVFLPERLGVRPLFYTLSGDTLIFASEIKSLLAHPNVNAEIDLQALQQIFTYWLPVAPRSIFRNIFELPAGHSLMVEHGEMHVRPYWKLDYSPLHEKEEYSPAAEKKCAEELQELLFDATRIRLRADVPVGAYLLGVSILQSLPH